MSIVPRPTILPEWATDNVVDPISGQNNVVTPPPEKMTNGWDLKEFPPRQWFNWLGRYTYLWLQYLDQQEAQSTVNDGTGAAPTFDVSYAQMAILYVIDTNTPTDFFLGIAYIPANPVAPIPVTEINSNVLTVSTISITGVVTVTSSASDWIMYGQSKNIPA